MSAAAYTTYYNMITRGTCDLAMIDAALAKKFITTDEANRLRTYWHSLNDPQAIEQMAVATTSDRIVVVTWLNPRKFQVDVAAGDLRVSVDAVTRLASLSGFADTDDVVTVTAAHNANGVLGPVSSLQVQLPPVPAPVEAPVEEPVTTDPEAPATDPQAPTTDAADTTEPTTA